MAAASLILLLTGCMPQRVSMRAMVTALEMTKTPTGWKAAAEYRMRSADTDKQIYGIYKGEGRSYEEALQNLEISSESGLYLDSVGCLIVDRSVSRGELFRLLAAVDDDGRVRSGTLLVFSDSVLENKNSKEWSAGEKIQELLGESGKWQNMGRSIKDALNTLQTVGLGGFVPVVTMENDGYIFDGVTLLGETKLVQLSREEAKTLPLQLLAGQLPVLTLPCESGVCDVALERGTIRTSCILENNMPKFIVTVSLQGYYKSVPEGVFDKTQVSLTVADALKNQVEKEFETMISQNVKANQTDIFSFGKICSFYRSNAWQVFEKNWPDYLVNVEYSVIPKIKVEDKRQLLR